MKIRSEVGFRGSGMFHLGSPPTRRSNPKQTQLEWDNIGLSECKSVWSAGRRNNKHIWRSNRERHRIPDISCELQLPVDDSSSIPRHTLPHSPFPAPRWPFTYWIRAVNSERRSPEAHLTSTRPPRHLCKEPRDAAVETAETWANEGEWQQIGED